MKKKTGKSSGAPISALRGFNLKHTTKQPTQTQKEDKHMAKDGSNSTKGQNTPTKSGRGGSQPGVRKGSWVTTSHEGVTRLWELIRGTEPAKGGKATGNR